LSSVLAYQNKRKDASKNHNSIPSYDTLVTNLPTGYPSSVAYLHHTIGNQAVQRLMHSNNEGGFDFAKIAIQPKLKISQPGDVYEEEADRVADQVMSVCLDSVRPMTTTKEGGIDRKCAACEMNEEEDAEEQELNIIIQKPSSTTTNLETTEETANEISNVLSSSGSPLDSTTRQFIETRFGHDFSHVRLHTNTKAAESAQSLNARAYTMGNHIVFGSGEFRPDDPKGQKLIAHELTHVLQQNGNSITTNALAIADPASAAEQEASAWAQRFGSGDDSMPSQVTAYPSAGVIHRQPAAGASAGGQAGFGKEPSARSLLVTIVGHASPRWKGASTKEEADRLNEKLAKQRAEVVRAEIKQLIHNEFGQNVKIDFDMSRAEGEHPSYIGINTSSAGSRDTLAEVGGDRERNDEISRRVDVVIEMLTTKFHEVGRSVPAKRISTYTKVWDVRIKRLLVSGIVIPGPAWGWVELVIRNYISGKEMLFRAMLYGGGDPMPQDTPDKDVGQMRTFTLDEEMGFDDFKGEYVRIERLDLQLGLGVSRYYLSFPNHGEWKWENPFALDSGPFAYMGQTFGPGFPGGYIVSGSLSMVGTNPGDYYEDESSPTETSVITTKNLWSEGLILTFPTESSKLSPSEDKRLKQFVATWRRRFP
jgi:hypothetical protein